MVQITTGYGTYTCPTKEVDRESFFKFKNVWYKVSDYMPKNSLFFELSYRNDL